MAGNYYRPSGRFTPIGALTALGVGLVSVALLSWVYGYLMAWIPLVYFLVLGVIGYGSALGALTGKGLKKGRIRNPVVAVAIGALVGVAGVYAGWVIWILAMWDVFIVSPEALLMAVQKLGEEGVWSMSGTTPTGWFLYSFWICEAAIILGWCVYLALRAVTGTPFCERCSCWMEPGETLGVFATDATIDEVKRGLELEKLDVLAKLIPLEEVGSDFTVAMGEGCDSCDYRLLSFKQMNVTLDKDGNEQVKEKTLINRLVASPQMMDAVIKLTEHIPEVEPDDEVEEPTPTNTV